jgi:hypothetical protein
MSESSTAVRPTPSAPDVLRDEKLCQTSLTDAGGPEHQRVTNTLAKRQADIDFMGFDTVKAR